MKKLVIIIFASLFMTSCASVNKFELSVFGLDHYGQMGYTEAEDFIYNLNYNKYLYDEIKISSRFYNLIRILEPPMGMGPDKKLLYDKKSIKILSENHYEINLLMVNNAFTLDIPYGELKPSDTWTNLKLSCPVDRLQITKQIWFYDHALKKYPYTYDASHWRKDHWWHPVNRYAELTLMSVNAGEYEGISLICGVIEDHFKKIQEAELEKDNNFLKKSIKKPKKIDTKNAKEQCLDLGFKENSKKYKDCVLELL